MPELPEVEVVLRTLEHQIKGKTIQDVTIYYDKLIKDIEPEEFRNVLIGKRFQDFNRKGKFLIFGLSGGISLIAHLRMEGKFFLKKDEIKEKHEHIIFHLDDAYLMTFVGK